mmetsp:Transcript_94680/g.271597  ORF Transcript_94680/g.271597 Transcript_94680/m.271597 type:complete len:201 (-) Transcript_94680:120-722(-)
MPALQPLRQHPLRHPPRGEWLLLAVAAAASASCSYLCLQPEARHCSSRPRQCWKNRPRRQRHPPSPTEQVAQLQPLRGTKQSARRGKRPVLTTRPNCSPSARSNRRSVARAAAAGPCARGLPGSRARPRRRGRLARRRPRPRRARGPEPNLMGLHPPGSPAQRPVRKSHPSAAAPLPAPRRGTRPPGGLRRGRPGRRRRG